ncbi:Asd/ArgC dimerization domain-containing protein [Pantoea ananatis]
MADSEGSVESERRLVDQVRKVLQDEGLPVAVSSIQAPVFYGNAQIVLILKTCARCRRKKQGQELALAADIHLSEEDAVPTPVTDASGSDELSIGCVRNDYGIPELLQFWSVADNVRFGGALMAVKTAEKLVQEYMY